MSDRLAAAQRIHQRALERVAGEWVVYRHGALTARLKMVRGQSQFTSQTSDGETIIDTRSIDWLIDPERLITDAGSKIDPSAGATITPDKGDGVFELTNENNGRAWSWSDGRGSRIRIHTQRTEDQ